MLLYVFVLGRDRYFTGHICIKETFFCTNFLIDISPHLKPLANLGCQ